MSELTLEESALIIGEGEVDVDASAEELAEELAQAVAEAEETSPATEPEPVPEAEAEDDDEPVEERRYGFYTGSISAEPLHMTGFVENRGMFVNNLVLTVAASIDLELHEESPKITSGATSKVAMRDDLPHIKIGRKLVDRLFSGGWVPPEQAQGAFGKKKLKSYRALWAVSLYHIAEAETRGSGEGVKSDLFKSNLAALVKGFPVKNYGVMKKVV